MAVKKIVLRSMAAKSARWAKRIAQWEGSGRSQRAFCAARGLALSSFQWWRARSKRARAQASPVSFLPLPVAQLPRDAAMGAVEVELVSKTRIRFEGAAAERAIERLLERIR